MDRLRHTTALTLLLIAAAAAAGLPAQTGRDVGVFRRDQPRSTARKLALVVGCNSYGSLPALGKAEKDVADVAAELEHDGFLVTRMRMDSGLPGEPKPVTGGMILDQVEKLCVLAEQDGVLLFYFSGHGFAGRDGRNYLCAYGTSRNALESTGLAVDEIERRFVQTGVKQRILVFDMCRNDPSKSGGDRAERLNDYAQVTGTGVLFSAESGFCSFEPVPGMQDEKGVAIDNGMFTHYFLRGLRGEADRGRRAVRDGFVSFREVAYFVEDGLAKIAMQRGDFLQKPRMRWDGTAEDPLLRVLPEEPVAEAAPAPVVRVPEPARPAEPEASLRDVSAWGEVLRADPDPAVVTDAAVRAKIVATGYPWRVKDRASGIVLLLVPAGEFVMGSPASEASRNDDERQHRRRITKAFYLGETEVTQAQWRRVMGENPSAFVGDDNPVEQVSWDDVQPFLQKTALRLPSEAEWEYGCRAGTTTPFAFGSTLSTDQANYDGNYTYGDGRKGEYRQRTVAVGTLGRNAWGFADMHGNVWEWCADTKGDYPADGADASPATGGASRVLRGGSWNHSPRTCRSAFRSALGPADRYDFVGFRAARTP